MNQQNQPRPHAFVSHSSSDKNLFVRPLVERLTEQGARVWYDEYSLVPGDSLSASIDSGLVAADAGIVVISPAFIDTAKSSGWTHYELRGIVTNSIGAHGRRIIPIWLDVTHEDVCSWSPPLADLLAIDATTKPIDVVLLEILRIIAPELAEGLGRWRALSELDRAGKTEKIETRRLIQHPPTERLAPGNVPLRAFLVTEALSDCGMALPSDLDALLQNLSRDLHYERELRVWEAIAGAYSAARRDFDLGEEQRRALYILLLMGSMGQRDSDSVKLLGEEIATGALQHLQLLLSFVSGDVVIGSEEGIRYADPGDLTTEFAEEDPIGETEDA